jgi:hypothetical protein
MPAVSVVEMAVDQVVDMIAMRDGRMATGRCVHVVRGVAGACVVRRAAGGVRSVDRDGAFVDVIAVHHVEVTIMEIVDMATVLNREMAAVGAVLVVVGCVGVVGCHEKSCRWRVPNPSIQRMMN